MEGVGEVEMKKLKESVYEISKELRHTRIINIKEKLNRSKEIRRVINWKKKCLLGYKQINEKRDSDQ